jgi:hypothetical protein
MCSSNGILSFIFWKKNMIVYDNASITTYLASLEEVRLLEMSRTEVRLRDTELNNSQVQVCTRYKFIM